jgi:glycosyltransferase involved in cell wall biosynthesis
MDDPPLVSVGIPTYNRAAVLKRAFESVLAQDYSNLELIISDNGSPDETHRVCEEVCARDSRVKYIRQPSNLGPRRNFLEVLHQARGQFFICLGDDDWLDSSYIRLCTQKLIENPDYSIVCGGTKYYHQNGQFIADGVAVNLLQDCPEERVLAFYEQWSENPAFYGVMRRELVLLAFPAKVLGADLLQIAATAFMGKVRTINDTSINVSYSGMSRSPKAACEIVGISRIHALVPLLSIGVSACRDVALGSRAYASLGRWSRLSLAYKILAVFYRRFWRAYWAHPIRSALLLRDSIRKIYLT